MMAMLIYAGIDEAGYGPRLGPMVVGRTILRIGNLDADAPLPDLWQRLSKAVCRRLSGRNGRIAVNDSKKLTTKSAGIAHLEMGCLSFAALWGKEFATVNDWLEALGTCASALPWYEPSDAHPWQLLPAVNSTGEVAIARSMLTATAKRIGVEVVDFGGAVVCEDRFNELVERMHSKAAVSFTFVAKHLDAIWQQYGQHTPTVVVDRQGGRTRYRELLQISFSEARIAVLEETQQQSVYRLEGARRAMIVRFEVSAESAHMPVALASMVSKYTRELLMGRFNAWWCARIDGLKPTAGYATDANRWLDDVRSALPRLGIAEAALRRIS